MQTSQLFPVGLMTKWLNPEQVKLSAQALNWLLDASSLTARLKANCQQFKLEVLGQRVELCSEAESCADIHTGTEVLVREVLLYCDDKPHIFARSLLPLSSLTGEEAKLAHLGTKPLGHVIFSSPSLKRQYIQLAEFDLGSNLGQLCRQLQLTQTQKLWGRRSLFTIENKPLTVAEVFLPDALIYQTETCDVEHS